MNNRSGSGSGASGNSGSTPGGEMKQQAGQVVDQVKEQAAQLKDRVAETATGKIEDQKTQATSSLGNVTQVIRQTGQQLRSNDQDAIAQYIDRAADQLDNFTGYLRNREMREIVGDVESFARREPALFLGGAFVLGLLGARFLKSSSQAAGTGGTDWQSRQGYGTQAALSSYSSYSSMAHTQPIAVQQYSEPAAYTPSASGTSYPTPTAGGGMSGLGTGGSVAPGAGATSTPPTIGGSSLGSTSARTGAPDWQGGAIGATPTARPEDSILGTGTRDTTGGASRQDRSGDFPTSTRSGGDAGA